MFKKLIQNFKLPSNDNLNSLDPYATHQPILSLLIKNISKSDGEINVCDVGAGLYSTTLFRKLLAHHDSLNLFSFEHDLEWAQKVRSAIEEMPIKGKHNWILISQDNSWHSALSRIFLDVDFKIVFIDSAPWDSRTIALTLAKDSAEYVVVHDVDYFPHNSLWGKELTPIQNGLKSGDNAARSAFGFRDYSDLFSSWCEVFPDVFAGATGPPTLIGSNKLDLSLTFTHENTIGFRISSASWKIPG